MHAENGSDAVNRFTGSPILGTLESVQGRAEISNVQLDEHGAVTFDQDGETTIFYDGMETVTRDGEVVLVDADGAEVIASDVTLLGPDAAEDLRAGTQMLKTSRRREP